MLTFEREEVERRVEPAVRLEGEGRACSDRTSASRLPSRAGLRPPAGALDKPLSKSMVRRFLIWSVAVAAHDKRCGAGSSKR